MKNAWKFLAGCGCLSVIAGAAMIAVSFFAADKLGGLKSDDLAHYQNTREGRTGNLSENYVDFSFDYPKSWTLKPADPDNVNFVSVEKDVEEKTWENLNVGYYSTAGSREANEHVYSQLLGTVQEQFAKQYPNLEKVHEGPTKVGEYDAYEGLWSAEVSPEGKPVALYIRAILLPTPDATKGVTLLMMGTSFNPQLKKAEDLGTTGELADVVKSFRF
jgi:hypothetical protein